MPTELLALPPSYTLVGLYRLINDPSIRDPVIAKVKHGAVRGAVVGAAYATLGWGIMGWFVRHFIIKGRAGERVTLGHGSLSINIDLELYTHLLLLIPQVGHIMKFFMRKNLRIARARAYALTVASRKKPQEFWMLGYVEEWVQPPVITPEERASGGTAHEAPWVGWMLWWPSQMIIRNFILLPLRPELPLLLPIVVAVFRALQTAQYLHKPYFAQKHMSKDQTWLWMEERKHAYRWFGFVAALLERIPILGLFCSISNNVGAAMWAHDLEKRQHLFALGIVKPLPPNAVGIFGSGTGNEITPQVVAAEKQIEAKWSLRPAYQPQVVERTDSEYPDVGPPPSYDDVTKTAPIAVSSSGAPSLSPSKAAPPLPPRADCKSSASVVPPPLPPRSGASGSSSARPAPTLPPRRDFTSDAEPHMPGAL